MFEKLIYIYIYIFVLPLTIWCDVPLYEILREYYRLIADFNRGTDFRFIKHL